MPLTAPITPLLFDDPVEAYNELAATVPANGKFNQDFDYSIVELPKVNDAKYLEVSFPKSPITDFDGDLDSWQIAQGSLGACGTFSKIACYSSFPQSSPWAVEKGIYPLTPSPIGLYLIRVFDPVSQSVKWVAIDSKVPCEATPTSKSTCIYLTDGKTPLLPALLTKASATMRGGSFNEITNHPSFKIPFTPWFPSKVVTSSNPVELANYAQTGCIWVISMTQQFDDLGNKITPKGVVYGHAFGICDAIQGEGFILFRIENPWSSASSQDYVSKYSDDAPFWNDHPELAQKKADSFAATGNYWVDFATLCKLSGKTSFNVTVPL